jgi:hypothetical protein
MRIPADRLRSSVRFSFGATTTEAEIDEALARIVAVVGRVRGGSTRAGVITSARVSGGIARLEAWHRTSYNRRSTGAPASEVCLE